ncbi:uncharacterized protein N7479_009939 [Penicillium vulpinum]|uniref:Major facilitator superfamily (MFS) profile domain-containing protein n=1 Tax=Penicillium vulpinum TaxID=29845 RepID=A0A1V6RXP6_9EURO|nr:uncharacterized protein N7479_009939 [Penicillium vulpinum]KAJ5951526.1 hypothetical protein N7479_009939 [Penicillium vulpinum]OQE06537.1 hypothetical protein PENVUL_c017G03731 [Penicillium vulpinum]
MTVEGEHKWNWQNFVITFAISLGQWAFAYPSAIIGSTMGQPSFLRYMEFIEEDGTMTDISVNLQGAMTGVFQAGAFFGILLVSWVMDRYGRKAGMIFCAILSIVGGSITTASNGVAMFIVSRFISGGGSWGFLAVTPVYTSELSPPNLRGLFVGMNGVNIAVGYALASYMGLAFFYVSDPAAQWRCPLGIALVFPVGILLIMAVVPESPRWLLMKGRTEDARKITLKLHKEADTGATEYAEAQFEQMYLQAEVDRTLNPTWREMFLRPSYRKRAIVAIAFAFIGHSTGVTVINNYGPTLYKALGYDSEYQLILQTGWITMAIPANILGVFVTDSWGRKPLILLGVLGCCACLIIEAALVAVYASPVPEAPNLVAIRAAVAILYLFMIFYSLGIDVAGMVFFGELFPNHLRAKGMGLAAVTIALSDFVYLQCGAIAYRDIGWKYYLVFVIVTLIGAIYLMVYVPETRGIPLEEMSALFGDVDEIANFRSSPNRNGDTDGIEPTVTYRKTDEDGDVITTTHVA